jgi:large repetitive protein
VINGAIVAAVTPPPMPWSAFVLFALSTGCLSNGSAGTPDVDRDGFDATEDCDDRDANVNPDATETCNGVDDDCDGYVDTDAQSGIYWSDEDGDGYGTTSGTLACEPGEHFVEDTSDCDDSDAEVHPGAIETCNSTDDDCDGEMDEDAGLVWHRDEDGDGWGVEGLTVTTCIAPSGYVDETGDCDDSDDRVNPGTDELCGDHVDNDCDDLIDGKDDEVTIATWYLDADFDEFGTDKTTVEDCSPPFGYVNVGGDCNDIVFAINPKANEVCDGEDNDCDKLTDEAGADGETTWYFDGDNDGYGVATKTLEACDEPTDYAPNGDDCDDDALVSHPGASELCDKEDNDCDGDEDEDTVQVHWYADDDGDTYGDPDDTVFDCAIVDGYVTRADDCDDTDDHINPDGIEVCNGEDDDCNSVMDDDATDAITCHTDADADSYGTPEIAYDGCSPPATCEASQGDCDDTRADVNPGVDEICDGADLDENCNTLSDDDDPGTTGTFTSFFPDADDDGYGDQGSAGARSCDATSTWETADASDCDDANADISPAGREVCDSLDTDEDCDRLVDILDPSVEGTFTAYTDSDLDGFGALDDPGFPACDESKGIVADHTDCDDAVATTYPGADDLDGGVDDDCDEWIDEDALVGGDLILTEIMPNPSGADSGREWFELLNPSKSRTVYLDGWAFSKDDGMAPETFFVSPEAGLWAGPGERLLFCEDATVFEAEAVSATCDYEYGTASNGLADSIHGAATADSWDFHSLYDSLSLAADAFTVDDVVWAMKTWPFVEGMSETLSESHLDATSNDDPASWCNSSELYDTGGADADYGTPGLAGSCP